MSYLARAPAKVAMRWHSFTIRVLLELGALTTSLGRTFSHRWRVLRQGGDRGVESVELAIGIALGLALALVVWAVYETLVRKYLTQVQ